ncbi:squalene monooxygenase [Panaeolus papilionaceus]|nr:squalene monooxygenase [Panaeolus papilionaceus]
MPRHQYDIVIVGAGIAGSSLAHALASLGRTVPLRIALVERSFSQPDRIVGELLQPGGVEALKTLNMSSALEGIDAVLVMGYHLIERGESVQIPYPLGREGRSFHHGRFVMGLRRIALGHTNVQPIEATATALIECPLSAKVIGVRTISGSKIQDHVDVYGSLIVVADGCFSTFRALVMGDSAPKVTTKSYFVGTILEEVQLPAPQHGTVVLPPGSRPVLLYQISERDTRMLIDIQHPLPSDVKGYILSDVVPALPLSLQKAVELALENKRLRRMPNSFLPPVQQGRSVSKQGVLLVGDCWNMRHPLTGGGMTVALNDVIYLRDTLSQLESFDDWKKIERKLRNWHWARKPLSSTINILSGTLYGLFEGADDDYLALRRGCFRYFQLGGRCKSEPISLLSGITPSPLRLVFHFFAVIFYAIWVVYTDQSTAEDTINSRKTSDAIFTSMLKCARLPIKSCRMFWKACGIFFPILWSEIRWWAPS